MGQVIAKTASVEHILRDVERASGAATAQGSPYKEDAERFLGPVLAHAGDLQLRIATAAKALDAARAQQRVQAARCDDLVGRRKDDLWNTIGRPANDVEFSHLFPNGIADYVRPAASRKPALLKLLANLV